MATPLVSARDWEEIVEKNGSPPPTSNGEQLVIFDSSIFSPLASPIPSDIGHVFGEPFSLDNQKAVMGDNDQRGNISFPNSAGLSFEHLKHSTPTLDTRKNNTQHSVDNEDDEDEPKTIEIDMSSLDL